MAAAILRAQGIGGVRLAGGGGAELRARRVVQLRRGAAPIQNLGWQHPSQPGPTRTRARGRAFQGVIMVRSSSASVSMGSGDDMAGEEEPTRSLVRVPQAEEGDEKAPASLTQVILGLPIKRISIWACFFYALWCVQDFFGLMIGTFILSFLGSNVVDYFQTRFPELKDRRSLLVTGYFLLIVTVVAVFGLLTLPSLVREGSDFVVRLQSEDLYVIISEKMRMGLGDTVCNTLERFLHTSTDVADGAVAVAAKAASTGAAATGGGGVGIPGVPGIALFGRGAAPAIPPVPPPPVPAANAGELGLALQKALLPYTGTAITLTSQLITTLTRLTVNVAISMIVSFMVVADLPQIRAGMRTLAKSRLSAFYNEIAPPVCAFGRLFGKALQAQLRIAVANTMLTAGGIFALGLPGGAILTLFVFLCSFIPVAGVFLSTLPMAFVALTEYGFFKLGMVLVMVFGIHFIEAYLLNPMIYSSHLKLHPLLVLGAMVVAEHSFGVTGLLMAVPLTVFLLDYCVRYPACTLTDVVGELETALQPEGSQGMDTYAP